MAPRKEVPIERAQEGGLPGETVERHPSFGVVGLFQTSGLQKLFGSPLEYNNGYVTLKISHAEKCHSGHGYDRYFPRQTVVEIMLSEAQFSQLITSWNSGEGTPCTLDFIATGGEGDVPTWPRNDYVSDTEQVRNEFKDRIEDVKKSMDASASKIEGLLEKKGALTLAEKGQIRESLTALRRLVDDTAPFMSEQFVEVTEKVVQKAMTEIDAFVTKVVRHTGLEALKNMEVAGLKSLPDSRALDQLKSQALEDQLSEEEKVVMEDILNGPKRVLHPGDAICSKCYRKFSLVGRSLVFEGPTLCDECEADDDES